MSSGGASGAPVTSQVSGYRDSEQKKCCTPKMMIIGGVLGLIATGLGIWGIVGCHEVWQIEEL
jgi:hypothetical protein